jgi:hypothetical protein
VTCRRYYRVNFARHASSPTPCAPPLGGESHACYRLREPHIAQAGGLPNYVAGDLKDSQSHTVADETWRDSDLRRASLSAPAPAREPVVALGLAVARGGNVANVRMPLQASPGVSAKGGRARRGTDAERKRKRSAPPPLSLRGQAGPSALEAGLAR